MNRLIFLLILACQIAVTAPISAEEIKLTTIVPDQTVLRAKRGTVGDGYSTPGSPTYVADNGSIPTSSLLVEGNVGIGTPAPNTTLDVNGAVSVKGMASQPPLSPASEGRIYFDSGSSKFRASENGGAYGPLGGSGGGGPVFLNSPQVITLPNGVSTWTTADVSAVVPNGATAVILQAEVGNPIYWTSAAFPAFSVSIRIRKNAVSSEYYLVSLLNSGRAGVNPVELQMDMFVQGTCPITPARTFQYRLVQNSNSYGSCYIRVIGYYQ